MKKNQHYLLLIAGILLINAETLLTDSFPIPDFLNGMLKGLAMVSFTAFIYYCLKQKAPGSKQVPNK